MVARSGLALPERSALGRGVVYTWAIAEAVAPDIVPAHMRCVQDILEACGDGSLLDELFQQEDASLDPCSGVPVVDLENPRERRLGNLADGGIELPLGEGLPQLLSIQLVEHVLRADERRGQELQLSPLLHRVLINLFVQSVFLLADCLKLAVDVVKILHVLCIALLLVSQRLLLARQVLLLTLCHYHRIFPSLEIACLLLLGFSGVEVLDALAERR